MNGRIDNRFLLRRVRRCNGGDDCILAFECFERFGLGVVVANAVHFDVGGEGGFGIVACEDGDDSGRRQRRIICWGRA